MATTDLTTLVSGCGSCGKMKDLKTCSRCKVISYCSREHQSSHYPLHKSACIGISRKRDDLDEEERKLRALPPDFAFPGDVFTNGVGHFWGILDTRDYMRARFAVVESLQGIKTRTAVQAQLDHLMDMLRLCRSDNMGVRDLVPSLMLRLDKDQECYDFVKWWATTAQEGEYDWGDMDLPYLDVKNADVFEPVGYLCARFSNLSHTVGVTLLKIKLLLDLTGLQCSTALGEKVPTEILDDIRAHVPRSQIIATNVDIMQRTDHKAAIVKLKKQVGALYRAVDELNKYFWPALLRPENHLSARPFSYAHGTVEHMQLALKYSYDAWLETPGAIEMIKGMRKENEKAHCVWFSHHIAGHVG